MKRILAAAAFSLAVTIAGTGAANAAAITPPGCASQRCPGKPTPTPEPRHRCPKCFHIGPINKVPHPIGFPI